ncbi:MAG: hypothetical protein AB9903_32895 [Vulcanimicrobiota bacterium]
MTSLTEQNRDNIEKWREHGFFTDDGKEFVVVKPETRVPWMNFLGNTRFGSLISHTGEGFCYYLDPLRNRITRWRAGGDYSNTPGRFLFLKDNETREYWSQNGISAGTAYQKWEARHGLGYTTIRSRVNDITSQITCFVPLDANAEIWMVHIKNEGTRDKDLSIYSLVEPVMGNAVDDTLASGYYSLFNEVFFQNNVIWGVKNQWTKREQFSLGKNPGNLVWNMLFYFVSSLKADSYDCDRDAFHGHARSVFNPAGIEKEQLSNSSALGTESIAALHHRISLKAGEELRFQVIVGVSQKDEDVKPLIQKLLTTETAAHELERIRAYWDTLCTNVWLETPDEDINRSFNIWLKYQAMNQIYSGDSMMYHETSRTDTSVKRVLQNLLTGVTIAPETARKKLLEITQYQFFEGDCAHSIVPLLGRGTRTGNSDHQLWLPFLISHYCRETGDYDILDEKVSYHDRGEATVLDHCIRALYFVRERQGPHGLPLILNGDFDEMLDQVGREGKGESVPLAMLLVHIMKRFLVILAEKKNETLKTKLMTDIERLTNSINGSCWDGSWYIRAFGDDQAQVGSNESEYGTMFLLPQVWAVISGVAPRDRGQLLLNAITAHLDCASGTRYLCPPFSIPDQSLGIITRLSPGKRENAGTVKSVALWRLMAECLYGNGDFVYETLMKLLSSAQFREKPDTFRSEPFLESEYIDGPESQDEGRASLCWGNTTASWMFRLIHDWICGIRLEQRGMKVDPCIPQKWGTLVIKKQFKGSLYHITIDNREHVSKGVKKILIEDREMSGAYIPVFGDGKVHNVTVVMGRKEEKAAEPVKVVSQVEKDEDRATGGLELKVESLSVPEKPSEHQAATAEQAMKTAEQVMPPASQTIVAPEQSALSEEVQVPSEKAEPDDEESKATVKEPTAEEPAAEEPAAEEPAAEEPAAEEPAAEEPAAEEPAVKEPAAEEPAVKEPKPETPAERPVLAIENSVSAEKKVIESDRPRIEIERPALTIERSAPKVEKPTVQAEAMPDQVEGVTGQAAEKTEQAAEALGQTAKVVEQADELPPMPDSEEVPGELPSGSDEAVMPPLPEDGAKNTHMEEHGENESDRTGGTSTVIEKDSNDNDNGMPVDKKP